MSLQNKEPKVSLNILYKDSILKDETKKERNLLLKELKDNLSPAQIFYSSIIELKRIKYLLNQNKNTDEIKKEIENIFLNESNKNKRKTLIKNLQVAINILNKNRRKSPIKSKELITEDGIYGAKTKIALDEICKNYSLDIIKKYIKKGEINNIIFNNKIKLG